MSKYINEFPQHLVSPGVPAFNYRVYFGEPNQNPLTNPKTVYSDAGLTIPIAQPLILNSDGLYGQEVFLNGEYSIQINTPSTVANPNGVIWQSAPAITGIAGSLNTVSTVAEAKASTNLLDGQGVYILGYYAAADDGGGMYVYDASSAATANDGTVLALDTLAGRLIYSDVAPATVKTFGAVGDGVADDTIFVQAGISSGLSLGFGRGNTYIVTDITWSQSNVRYFGKSSLKLKDSADTNISSIGNNVTDIVFDGLEFDGNGATQTATVELTNGVTFPDNCQRIKFTNCYFHDFGPATKQPEDTSLPADYNYGSCIVQISDSATNNSDITVEKCRFENAHAGVAIRGTGDNLRVLNCDFKHCADNSVKTRTGYSNIFIDGCRDEDTRGAEAWGSYLRYTNNYSLNSHRHGVSGGIKKCFVSGNTFRHTTANLGSLYAVEIGLSEECIVTGNHIEDWDGTAAILMTDSANQSANTVISNNTVKGGSFVVGAIGSSNAQDNCIYDGNILIDVEGIAIAPRGNNLVISNNIVKDNSADLLNALTTACLSVAVGSQHIITNNSFNLAGPWVSGTFRNVMSGGGLSDSIIKGNYLYGGRNTINGGLDNSIITNNRIDSVEKVINSDTGSQGGIFINNILDNYTNLLDSGDYAGFSYSIQKQSQGASAPTDGDWSVGDKVYNSSPSASGTVGWVCTSGGTPGTWKTFGAISA